jgi:hypothetical protein
MIFKPQYFKIYELVDEDTFLEYGERSWQFLDDRLLKTIDWVRRRVGPLVVNTKVSKGRGIRNWSGFRNPNCYCYSPTSQHSAGRAIDAVSHGATAQRIREMVLEEWPVNGHPWSVTMESGVSWFHIDVRQNKHLVNFFKG